MGQRDHLLFGFSPIRSGKELHIHCIRMADGNACLKPAELYVPHASEGVRACLKAAALVIHDPMLAEMPAGIRVKSLARAGPLATGVRSAFPCSRETRPAWRW